MERTRARSHPDVGNVPTFCFPQAGFRVRRHLFKLCIVPKHVGCNLAVTIGKLMFFHVFQLTAFIFHGTVTSGERFTTNLDRVAIKEDVVRGVLLYVQGFVSDPFSRIAFFSQGWVSRCCLMLMTFLIATLAAPCMPRGQK